jgi:hypothetical protein
MHSQPTLLYVIIKPLFDGKTFKLLRKKRAVMGRALVLRW